MKGNDVYSCDLCGTETDSISRIGITVHPVTKHLCSADCYVTYCDKHKILQNTLAYAMYKDLISSTDSKDLQQGESHDT